MSQMWRGTSLRKLGMLVFGPMMTEALATLFVAWMVLYAEKTLGYQAWQHMLIPMAGSVGYASSAYISGRWVTPRWAPRLMIGTILLVAFVGAAAPLTRTYLAFTEISFLIGVFIGHYYTPFQINMTHVRPFHTLAWSVAFYNVAWGTGAALGPFLGSSMRTASAWELTGLAVGLAVVHTVLAAVSFTAPPPRQELAAAATFYSTPAQRRMTVVAFLSANSVIRGLFITILPHLGDHQKWEDWQIGLGQFCIFAPIPVGALLWAKLRHRLDRPWIMLASMVAGLLGFAALIVIDGWVPALVCLTAIGVMESCVVFHAIYYMNADPDPVSRGRNIGLFEMCAGLAAITGPVCLGSLAWLGREGGMEWLPFAFSTLVVALAIVYVLVASQTHAAVAVEADSPR